jgi:hypothetical protein
MMKNCLLIKISGLFCLIFFYEAVVFGSEAAPGPAPMKGGLQLQADLMRLDARLFGPQKGVIHALQQASKEQAAAISELQKMTPKKGVLEALSALVASKANQDDLNALTTSDLPMIRTDVATLISKSRNNEEAIKVLQQAQQQLQGEVSRLSAAVAAQKPAEASNVQAAPWTWKQAAGAAMSVALISIIAVEAWDYYAKPKLQNWWQGEGQEE